VPANFTNVLQQFVPQLDEEIILNRIIVVS